MAGEAVIETRNGQQYVNGYKLVNPIDYKWKVLMAAFFGQAFDIMDFMAIALALPLIIKDWGLSLVAAGGVASMTLIGSAIGAYCWGPAMDKWGRKKIYILCLLWMTVFSGACAFVPTMSLLLVFRFLAGFALGGLWVLGSTLLNEFTPTDWRANASAFVQSASLPGYGGILLINIYLVPVYGWRPLFLISWLAVLLALYIAVAIPESPSWIKAKFGILKQDAASKAAGTPVEKPKMSDLLVGKYSKSTWLGALLVVSFLVSYWGLQAWTPTYLVQERGVSLARMSWIMLSMNVGGFFGYYASGWVATRFTRRQNYLYGCTLAGITMYLFTYIASPSNVMFFSFLLGFISFGYIGALAVFIGEQFPTQLRASGISFAWGTGRLSAAIVPTALGGLATATSLQTAIGLMGIICALGSICAYFMKDGLYTDNE
ncbi:MAG TPA: MFS transporter [Syntrophomonadaceae bacterium]|nr:MFS transporter [Syntrophomonadaceae bacterium]